MPGRERISQYLSIDQGLAPTDIGATTANTGWIAFNDCDMITGKFTLAADYTDATCVCTAKIATDSSGTGSQAVTGLTITLDAASEQGILEMNSDNLYEGGATDGDYDYIMFIATEASNVGVNYVCIDVMKDGMRHKSDTATLNSGLDETDFT